MRGPGYPTPRRRLPIPESCWHIGAVILGFIAMGTAFSALASAISRAFASVPLP